MINIKYVVVDISTHSFSVMVYTKGGQIFIDHP